MERKATLRQDAFRLRPVQTLTRGEGFNRNQPSRNRQLLVRGLRKVFGHGFGLLLCKQRRRTENPKVRFNARAIFQNDSCGGQSQGLYRIRFSARLEGIYLLRRIARQVGRGCRACVGRFNYRRSARGR